MNCKTAQELIVQSKYTSTKQDVDLLKHLESCNSCKLFIAQQKELDSLLSFDKPIFAKSDFDSHFFSKLQTHQSKQSSKSLPLSYLRWWFAAASFATAATLLFYFIKPIEKQDLFTPDLNVVMNLELVENLDLIAMLSDIEDFDVILNLETENKLLKEATK